MGENRQISKKIFMFDRLNGKLLITTMVILLVLSTLMYSILSNAGYNWDIDLNTISGDVTALKGISIAGTVLDYDNFILEFEIVDGKIQQQLNKKPDAMKKHIYSNIRSWDRLYTESAEYEMSFMGSAGTLAVSRKLYSKNYSMVDYARIEILTGFGGKTVEISPNQQEASSQPKFDTNSASGHVNSSNSISINVNSYTPTMQEIDGKLYFIIPKVKGGSGSSGLYVVDSFDKFNSKDGYRKLADIPLNGGENEMIVLEKVGVWLCLIRHNDMGIALQRFNLGKQAFESEFLDMDTEITNSKSNQNQIYEVYSNSEYINVILHGSKGNDIYTYSIKDGIRRQNKLSDYRRGSDNYTSNEQILYNNNLLYILQKKVIRDKPEVSYIGVSAKSDEVICLNAYDAKGDLVYSGELDACQNDDNIRYKKFNERLLDSAKKGFVPWRKFSDFKLSASKY